MAYRDDRKIKRVTIEADFEMAGLLVTQKFWQDVMGNNPSVFSRQGECKDEVAKVSDEDLRRFPVDSVSWNAVQDFLKALNQNQKGKGWVYRLPSEEEWEYACRLAPKTRENCLFDYYFDKPSHVISSTQANFDGPRYSDAPFGEDKEVNIGRPVPVGSYPPNKLGLYDMHGNLSQWCSNWVAEGKSRAARGGDFVSPSTAGTIRFGPPDIGCRNCGLRLVRVSEAK